MKSVKHPTAAQITALRDLARAGDRETLLAALDLCLPRRWAGYTAARGEAGHRPIRTGPSALAALLSGGWGREAAEAVLGRGAISPADAEAVRAARAKARELPPSSTPKQREDARRADPARHSGEEREALAAAKTALLRADFRETTHGATRVVRLAEVGEEPSFEVEVKSLWAADVVGKAYARKAFRVACSTTTLVTRVGDRWIATAAGLVLVPREGADRARLYRQGRGCSVVCESVPAKLAEALAL